MENDLAVSDPDLSEFFWWFAVGTAGRKMPRTERVLPWPRRMLARLWRGKSVTGRVKDWCAENWNDP
jgi:hypothetical protein